MEKAFFATMAMVMMFSTSLSAEAQSAEQERSARETYTRLYRVAPLSCRAPQCVTERRPRRLPVTHAEYQEANRFLVAGARACLVDCTCTVQNAATPDYCSQEQSPAPRAATPIAPTPAPVAAPPAQAETVAETPARPPVAATPALPPYMSAFAPIGGMATAGLGWCHGPNGTPGTYESIQILESGMRSEAIWFSNGSAPWQRQAMRTGGRTIRVIPMSRQFAMNVVINGRVVVPLVAGRVPHIVHRMQNGGLCVNTLIPENSQSFQFILDELNEQIDITVNCYSVVDGEANRPFSSITVTKLLSGLLNRELVLDDGYCGRR